MIVPSRSNITNCRRFICDKKPKRPLCPVAKEVSRSTVPASCRKKDVLFLPNKPLRLHARGEDIPSKKSRVSCFPNWNFLADMPSSGSLKRIWVLFCCSSQRLPELCRQTHTKCNCRHSPNEKDQKLLAEGVFPKPAHHRGCR